MTFLFTPLHFFTSSPSSFLIAYSFARKPTNSSMISLQASSLNIPGTYLLIPVVMSEGWFGEKFEVSNFSWTSSEIYLKKSSVSIS